MQVTETDHVRQEYAATAPLGDSDTLTLSATIEDNQTVIGLSGANMHGVSITLPLAILSPLADFIQSVTTANAGK